MSQVVVMKCLMIPFTTSVGVGVGDFKIGELESEVLCTNSTALVKNDQRISHFPKVLHFS
jgi:hypothetical protein